MDPEETNRVETALGEMAAASRAQLAELSSIRKSVNFLAAVAGLVLALSVAGMVMTLVLSGCLVRNHSATRFEESK